MRSLIMTALILQFSVNAFAQSVCGRMVNRERPVNEAIAEYSVGEVTTSEMQAQMRANRSIEYTAVKTRDGKDYSESDLFHDKADLTIGIDVTGNTQGHTYLVIDGQRFDGRMFWADYTLVEKNWVLSRGLIIRYKNVPEAEMAAIKHFLASGEPINVKTCVVAAMALLFEKAHFQGPGKRYLFPTDLLKFLAQHGLVTQNGTRLTPEVYTLNSNINKFWNNLPRWVTVPSFIFKVLFDPYTWAGKKPKPPAPEEAN